MSAAAAVFAATVEMLLMVAAAVSTVHLSVLLKPVSTLSAASVLRCFSYVCPIKGSKCAKEFELCSAVS